MTYSTILYETDDRVARITLNRPEKRNALSLQLCKEFRDAVQRADDDPEVRVVVVKGAGGKAFSAGYDFSDEDERGKTPQTLDELDWRYKQDEKFQYSVWECSKPVIAQIDGYCLAGGMELAQMCDVRYCSDTTRFGAVEARFAAGIATLSLPWLIGQRCRELIYTGDMFYAEEALRLGLVSRVFPKDRLDEEVTRIAKRMSRVALAVLRRQKQALNNALKASGFDAAMRYGTEACKLISLSETEFKHFRVLQWTEGPSAAIKWRDSIFAPFESETSWSSSRTIAPKDTA
ncbi:enoyl-CoA hydratase/isomerase family protein [Bradyrhizobium sp. UFLA05-112]